MSEVNIIVACERSEKVTQAMRAKGHTAYSCDQEPSEIVGYPYHFECDIKKLHFHYLIEWSWIDLLIAHPPCTDLAVSGARYFKDKVEKQAEAIKFAEWIWDLPIPLIAIENPIGVLSTKSKLGKPTQIIQPWQFGHDASKATCLWLKGLPKLKPTKLIEPHYRCRCGYRFDYELGKYGCPNCCGEKIARLVFGNQTPSGQNNEPPGENQATNRSRTYEGIAEAMAEQWTRKSLAHTGGRGMNNGGIYGETVF